MTEQGMQSAIGCILADLKRLCVNDQGMDYDPETDTLTDLAWAKLGIKMATMGYTVTVHPDGLVIDGFTVRMVSDGAEHLLRVEPA